MPDDDTDLDALADEAWEQVGSSANHHAMAGFGLFIRAAVKASIVAAVAKLSPPPAAAGESPAVAGVLPALARDETPYIQIPWRGSVTDLATDIMAALTLAQVRSLVDELRRMGAKGG